MIPTIAAQTLKHQYPLDADGATASIDLEADTDGVDADGADADGATAAAGPEPAEWESVKLAWGSALPCAGGEGSQAPFDFTAEVPELPGPTPVAEDNGTN